MLSQRSATAKGLLQGYLRPRIASDAALPNLDGIARRLGKRGFDSAEATREIRRAGAGLLDPSADLDDLPEFLAAAREILAKEDNTATTGEDVDMADLTDTIDEVRRLLRDLDPEARREVLEALRDDDVDARDGAGPIVDPSDPNLRRSLGPPSAQDIAFDAALKRYERAHPAPDGRGFASRFPGAAKIKVS